MFAAGLMLLSGALHAAVSTILKSGEDKTSGRALLDASSSLFVLPALWFVEPPTGAWGWLLTSWAVHVVYLACLVQAFSKADLGLAYPVMRGVAPALAALGAVVWFDEPITLWIALGVALVCVGVVAVGLTGKGQARGLGWALATGASIAVYTVTDAQGVRAAPSVESYVAWFFVLHGGGIGGLFALARGRAFLVAARSQWRAGLIAGLLSVLSYGAALWALRLGDTPRLAALRECSVVFGLAAGVIFLGEAVSVRRVLGAATILAGAAVLIALGR